MRSRILCVSFAALMAAGVGAPLAQAQSYGAGAGGAYDAGAGQPGSNYDASGQDYQQQQQDYQQQQDDYQRAQDHYQDRAAAYDARRDAYLRDRDAYDAHYGSGSFVAYYRDRPVEYDRLYGPGAYERDYGAPVAYEGPDQNACKDRKSDHAVLGGLLGAAAGAALGSNIVTGGARLGGSLIGGVLGAGAGASIGDHTVHCD